MEQLYINKYICQLIKQRFYAIMEQLYINKYICQLYLSFIKKYVKSKNDCKSLSIVSSSHKKYH